MANKCRANVPDVTVGQSSGQYVDRNAFRCGRETERSDERAHSNGSDETSVYGSQFDQGFLVTEVNGASNVGRIPCDGQLGHWTQDTIFLLACMDQINFFLRSSESLNSF